MTGLLAGGGLAAGIGAWVVWARRRPTPLPYSQRWMLVPLPGLSEPRLLRVLEARAGERLLEVGPGTGRHAVAVAAALRPGGTLEALDLQVEMVEHTTRRARDAGVANVRGVVADARELPQEDESFDGAYLVTTIGEVPDQAAALRELFRVLRPGGRLVVGESPLDPHYVAPRTLRRRAEAAGFVEGERLGRAAVGYLARFEKPVTGEPLRES